MVESRERRRVAPGVAAALVPRRRGFERLPAGKAVRAAPRSKLSPRNVSRAQDDGRVWTARTPKTAKDARDLQESPSEVDAVPSSVLQACVEVHRALGPGFFESIYELALDLD